MDKNAGKVIQMARISKGITQAKLAELSGYSPDTIQAWEAGARIASVSILDQLSHRMNTPWLTVMYLQELSDEDGILAVIPSFTPGVPVSEAAAKYISCMLDSVEVKFDRQLLRMVADGQIDQMENSDFEKLLSLGNEIVRAYLELFFSKR